MTAGSNAVDIVRGRIAHYAEQGTFTGFGETPGRLGRTTFRFRWLLGHEFSLVVDPTRRQLIARDLLPAVEHRSFMDTDLRRFVAGRGDDTLPAHRRLDADLAQLAYTNRKQAVSLVMEVHTERYEAALKALLGTINDLFTHLHLYHIDYLQREFGVPEE